MSHPCLHVTVAALLLWPAVAWADAPSAPLVGPLATGPVTDAASLALPSGLDLKEVHVTHTEAVWEVDANGRSQKLRFRPTGSRAVDDAIRDRVARRLPAAGTGKTVTEYAHVYFFPDAVPLPEPGPMIPAALDPPSPVPPPAPAGDRASPVLATDPTRTVTDPTPADFPGQQEVNATGKAFTVSWRVDETGTVTDVTVTPGDVPAVADGLIHHFLGLRYWPAVHNGKPEVAMMSHIYQF